MQNSNTHAAAGLLRAEFRIYGGGPNPLREFAARNARRVADPAAGRQIESHPAQAPGRLIDGIHNAMASRLRLADGGDRS